MVLVRLMGKQIEIVGRWLVRVIALLGGWALALLWLWWTVQFIGGWMGY